MLWWTGQNNPILRLFWASSRAIIPNLHPRIERKRLAMDLLLHSHPMTVHFPIALLLLASAAGLAYLYWQPHPALLVLIWWPMRLGWIGGQVAGANRLPGPKRSTAGCPLPGCAQLAHRHRPGPAGGLRPFDLSTLVI